MRRYNSKLYAVDCMFSGHALTITAITHAILEMVPDKKKHYYQIIIWTLAGISWGLIIASRAHYSIDVIMAVYITTSNWIVYDKIITKLEPGCEV